MNNIPALGIVKSSSGGGVLKEKRKESELQFQFKKKNERNRGAFSQGQLQGKICPRMT
jgi:hypothetical protein